MDSQCNGYSPRNGLRFFCNLTEKPSFGPSEHGPFVKSGVRGRDRPSPLVLAAGAECQKHAMPDISDGRMPGSDICSAKRKKHGLREVVSRRKEKELSNKLETAIQNKQATRHQNHHICSYMYRVTSKGSIQGRLIINNTTRYFGLTATAVAINCQCRGKVRQMQARGSEPWKRARASPIQANNQPRARDTVPAYASLCDWPRTKNALAEDNLSSLQPMACGCGADATVR